MSSAHVYGALLHLYPAAFRDEFGEDMLLAFRHLQADQGTGRAWMGIAGDLARSVPQRHLEARRRPDRATVVPYVLGALAVSSVVMAALVGTVAVGISGFALAAVLATRVGSAGLRRWGSSRPAATLPASRLCRLGGTVLAGLILLTTATGEVSDRVWAPLMLLFMTSVVLVTFGVALGIADRLVARRP